MFRGLSNKSYHLHTSLQRLNPRAQDVERPLLRAFKKYAHNDFEAHTPEFYWLAVAQHHGLATRLLDWTLSPNIALHFATVAQDKWDRDGVIWAVDWYKTHSYLPGVYQDTLSSANANMFVPELLFPLASTLKEFDQLAEHNDFILFFEPPALDQRIVNQYAYFSIMPSPQTVHCEWLESHPNTYTRFIIPAEVKPEIRDRLDQLNATERVMFPGLDGLAAWLNRWYNDR